MKKMILAAFVTLLSIPAIAGYSWDVQPGPNGSMKVNTSEGTYIVVLDGNHAWVGTEKEYEARRIAGVLKAEGYREMKIDGQNPNTHEIVSSEMSSASVGQTNLGNIYTEIYFDATADRKMHRPPKPAGSEYVGAAWVQSDKRDVQAKIIDRESNITFSPYYCQNVAGMAMRTCEFIVPAESLRHQSALLFAAAKSNPSVIPGSSLAKEQEKILLAKYKPDMGKRFGLDEDDANTLKRLHELDDSIAIALPPLPAGVTEIKPRSKSCREEELALTQAQFDAITVGADIDDLQCVIGVSSHTIWAIDEHNHYDIWKMKKGGFALVSTSDRNRTIINGKRIQRTVDIKW